MSDFRLGNMATDLAEYTLDMCNKNEVEIYVKDN